MDLRLKLDPLAIALALVVLMAGVNAAFEQWSVAAVFGGGGAVLLCLTATRRGQPLRVRGERDGTSATFEVGNPSPPDPESPSSSANAGGPAEGRPSAVSDSPLRRAARGRRAGGSDRS
jgi:hypothetical protein